MSVIQQLLESQGAWIIPMLLLVLLGKYLSRPSVKGRSGERQVNRGLKQLPSDHYTIYHDIYLPRPDGEGSTQVDHLVVSRFGLFVIETKNYQGWIFGDEKQGKWTQQIYRKRSKFQNPLHQNLLHIRALECFLGIERRHFHNIIYFAGDCTFKTKLPANVMKRGLLGFIKGHQEQSLSSDILTAALKQLDELVATTEKKQAAKSHKKQLQDRQVRKRSKQNGSKQTQGALQTQPPTISEPLTESATKTQGATSQLASNHSTDNLQIEKNGKAPAQTSPPLCPKCQIPMLRREAKRGANAGNQFWGCTNFPKCRSTS